MSWGPIPNKVNKGVISSEENLCRTNFISLYFYPPNQKFISGSQIRFRYSDEKGGVPLKVFSSVTYLKNDTYSKSLFGEKVIRKYSEKSCIVSSYCWGYVLREFNKDLPVFGESLGSDMFNEALTDLLKSDGYKIFPHAYSLGLKHSSVGIDPNPNYLFSKESTRKRNKEIRKRDKEVKKRNKEITRFIDCNQKEFIRKRNEEIKERNEEIKLFRDYNKYILGWNKKYDDKKIVLGEFKFSVLN